MKIFPYTPKSFIVCGDTYPHRAKMKKMHGTFINAMVDGKRQSVWCFSLKREPEVRAFIQSVSGVSDKPENATGKKATGPRKAREAASISLESLVAKEVARILAEKQIQEPSKPDVAVACTKEMVSRALAGDPVSAYHWAMRHVLSCGLNPEDVKAGTGLFGRDKNGKAFGETERKAMFWMLNSKAVSVDIACCEDCPEFLRSGAYPELFWDIVSDFSGPGGKSRLVEKCIELTESSVYLPF